MAGLTDAEMEQQLQASTQKRGLTDAEMEQQLTASQKTTGFTDEEMEAQLANQDSPLVDQIPGIGKRSTVMEPEPSTFDKVLGTGKAVASQALNLAGSAVAWPVAMGQSAVNAGMNAVTGSNYQTSPPENFENLMSGFYQPEDTAGHRANEWINENVTRHMMAGVPMMHDIAVAGETRNLQKLNKGIVSSVVGKEDINPIVTPKSTTDLHNPEIERGLLQQGYEDAQHDLATQQELHATIQERIANGDASKEALQSLEEVETVLNKYQEEVTKYEAILSGKTDASAAKTAANINAKYQEVEAAQARSDKYGGSNNRARELAPDEEAPMHDRIPDGWEETVDHDTGEITQEPAKQSPHEVALERIGAATDDPILAAKQLQEAQDRLDNLPVREGKEDTPGSQHSAITEALGAEVKAYKDIIAGKKPDLESYTKKVTEESIKTTPEKLAEPVKPKEFTSIDDAIATAKDEKGNDTTQTIRNFDDNPHLFDFLQNTKVGIDTRIAKPTQEVIKHLTNLTKLFSEKVYFVLDNNFDASGRTKHFGDTILIKLNPETIAKNLAENRKLEGFINYLGKGKITEALKTYHTVRYIAHELGHALLNKYLRDSTTHTDDLMALSRQFTEFAKKTGFEINSAFDAYKSEDRIKYQDTFHEFFAERITRDIMHQHVLESFSPKSAYIKSIGKMISSSIKFLEDGDIKLDKKNFADTIIKDILNDSKEAIAETSKRAANDIKILNNNKEIAKAQHADPLAFPFYKKSLEDVRNLLVDIPDMVRDGIKGDSIVDPTIEPVISMSSATRLGHGIARNIFGKVGVSRIFYDNPLIAKVYESIRKAEIKADEVNNKLWYGDPDRIAWNQKGFFGRMSKVVQESSAYWQTKMAKNADLAAVHDLFKKGFEQALDYQDNYKTNGTHLTPKQKELYTTFSKLFEQQHAEVVKLEQSLGKKNIMSKREGWYPAVRAGQYFVDISFNGRTLHREQFRSAVEANHFRSILKQSGTKNIVVSEAQHIKDTKQVSDMYGGLELAQKILEQRFPAAQGAIRNTIQQALEKVIARGGKLGSHHQYRSNLSGYRGSELFYNSEERGNSFRAAIQQSVNDYSGGLRKMIIQSDLDPIMKNGGLDPNHPMTQTAQQMIDSSLNRVSPNIMEKFDRAIIETWDTGVKAIQKEIGANQRTSFEQFNGHMLEFFYLTKLMSKIVFPIGQVLTIASSIRELSITGGYIRPYLAMGKAIGKLAMGSKDLKDALFDVSQTSNTFEAQFIEALHLKGNEKPTLEYIKDYVLLRKVNEGADTLSRVTVFSAAFEMYKDLGMSIDEAKRKAMDDTNTTMVPYGRTETAPIFNKMGIVGGMIKPLQTFGQQQLANWIHDFRYMKATDPKSWAPMLNYMLVSTALGGALSPMFIQEYEMIRKILEQHFPEWAPPALIELAKHDPEFLDRIVEDPTMVKKAMMYGIPAALTGIDIASSTRSNQTFLSLVGAVLSGEENFGQLLPHLNTIVGAVSGATTEVLAAFGKETSPAEKRKAITDALPSGAISYGVKELAGVNTTSNFGEDTGMVAGGKEQDAQVVRGPAEKTAGYLGTKSTEEKYQNDIQRQQISRELVNKQRVNKIYSLAIDTKDRKEFENLVNRLAELGETSDMIINNLSSAVFKNSVPALTRLYADKKGNVQPNMKNARTLSDLQQYQRR